MKKIFFALAVLMAIAITATGCKSKSTPKTADSVAVEEADTLVTDSFSYHSEQDSTVYSTLRIDYPQGEGSLHGLPFISSAREQQAIQQKCCCRHHTNGSLR